MEDVDAACLFSLDWRCNAENGSRKHFLLVIDSIIVDFSPPFDFLFTGASLHLTIDHVNHIIDGWLGGPGRCHPN